MKTKFRVQCSEFNVGRWTLNVERSRRSRAFTLVEVTLAIAVVAIGLVGILALFPLGLRATRGALDDTQMATIGQEAISIFQQYALTNSNYAVNYNNPDGTNLFSEGVANVTFPNTNYIALAESNVSYKVIATVTNSGFPQLRLNGTNLLSRVTIQVLRINPVTLKPSGSKTNTYITDIARYAK